MRWMLLLAFAVTVPAFVALVAWWTARTERPPVTSPRRRRGTPLAAIPDAPDRPRHRRASPTGGVAVARTRPSS